MNETMNQPDQKWLKRKTLPENCQYCKGLAIALYDFPGGPENVPVCREHDFEFYQSTKAFMSRFMEGN